MLFALVATIPLLTGFAPPRAWALGFGDSPRIPLVGDVDGDGCADLIAVYPKGDCIIDVNLTREGAKSSGGFQAITQWGKDCQAAAAGDLEGTKKADVVGIFEGKVLRLAGGFKDGHYTDTPHWATLPQALPSPALSILNEGQSVLAFSTRSGAAYEIDSRTRRLTPHRVPRGTVWLGDPGPQMVVQETNGDLYWLDRRTFNLGAKLGHESPNSRPAAGPGLVAWGDQVWTPQGALKLEAGSLPAADVVRGFGSMDSTGRPGIFDFRHGNEFHKGDLVLLRRGILDADQSDKDSASSDAYDRDSSNDGLLDGWKLHGYRGLDLKAMGCAPGHADVICLVSRFDSVTKDHVESEMKRIVDFYAGLKVKNPDGSTGIRFHPIYLEPVTGPDKNNPWWVNRDKFLPEKWRGVVHWMQITPGGGGQADELSNGGTCGEGALWAVFIHEFGHQLGLNHEGFWPVGASPIYTSLMNYTWSYSFAEDRNKIHYSDGSLSALTLNESDLDETLPFPYEKVKFLSMAPYHFKLKPNGATTLIDWNWNGIFGEKHVRAEVNYSYSTGAGTRDTVGKTKTAPWLFVHQGRAFVLYGANDLAPDPKIDPTLGPDRPGRLMLKRLQKPFKWDPDWTIESGGLIGDPVAVSYQGQIVACYQTSVGVVARKIDIGGHGPEMSAPVLIDPDKTQVPTLGVHGGKLYLFLWNPATDEVTYRILQMDLAPVPVNRLDAKSTNPVGLCTDTLTGEAVIGMAQDQDKSRSNRWQIRRYRADEKGVLTASSKPDWVEGEAGGARGAGRIIALFESGRDAGPKGRIHLYSKGMTSKESPWACNYVAEQIADKSYHGGWLVKRYYDEWTQTRSAPAAAWFNGDVLFAYRWVDGGQGDSDNILHVGYQGLGIAPGLMGDFDDLSYIRDFGLANSILSLGKG